MCSFALNTCCVAEPDAGFGITAIQSANRVYLHMCIIFAIVPIPSPPPLPPPPSPCSLPLPLLPFSPLLYSSFPFSTIYFSPPSSSSSPPDVPTWLKSLRLHKYAQLFAPLTYEDMLKITDEYLEKNVRMPYTPYTFIRDRPTS